MAGWQQFNLEWQQLKGWKQQQGVAAASKEWLQQWMVSAQGWYQQGTRQARDGMSTKVASSHEGYL
jgi:hypothetical protein